MKNCIYSIIILIFSYQNYAQNSFKKGYYISPSEDTIFGLIKDYDWKNNPDKISFKRDSNSKERIFESEDIKFFEILNQVKYRSAEVDIDMSENSISELSKNRLPEFEEKHLFLKVLEEGAANLYKYEKGNFVRYFFNTNESPLQQLIYKKYIYNSSIAENKNFRQQLLNALQCKALNKNRFINLKYKEKSLRKIITEYNSCSENSTYSYNAEKSKHEFRLSLRPGIQFASLETEEGIDNRLGTSFDNEISFRIGIELELIFPFNNKKWSMILEPTYQNYKSRVDYLSDGFYELNREVNYTSIEVPLSVRYYSFINSENQLFLNVGVAYDIGIGEDIIIGPRNQNLNLNASLNPVLGIGYRYLNRFSFEFRYQTGRDLFQEYATRKSTYTSASLIFGYKLL